MDSLPFVPFSDTLQAILRRKFIREVAQWLLGPEETSILAQKAGSVWESALTVIFLASVGEIFAAAGEESGLQSRIRFAGAEVARWLLTKKREITVDDKRYTCWEGVTWDTAVVIRALLISLRNYSDSFGDVTKSQIERTVVDATKWLYLRFGQWETEVKYPFGPADVAQIIPTVIYLRQHNPGLYQQVIAEFYEHHAPKKDLLVEIIEYLLHIKTDKKIRIPTGEGRAEDILTYWWVDYFSTSEVVEALAAFHAYGRELLEGAGDKLEKNNLSELLPKIRVALVRACTYFEQTQEDGTWGSHIDTIKVITAYVMTRRIMPQRSHPNPVPDVDELLVPEVHTTFKALRWICDEKQIFSDGSFMHTMFLTIFYAQALVEVHNSWDAAKQPVEKLYDDVVWASPMRTTPERSKRLAESLQKISILEELKRTKKSFLLTKKYLWTGFVTVLGVLAFLYFGIASGVIKADQTVLKLTLGQPGDFFQYLGVAVALFFGLLALIWKQWLKELTKDITTIELRDL